MDRHRLCRRFAQTRFGAQEPISSSTSFQTRLLKDVELRRETVQCSLWEMFHHVGVKCSNMPSLLVSQRPALEKRKRKRKIENHYWPEKQMQIHVLTIVTFWMPSCKKHLYPTMANNCIVSWPIVNDRLSKAIVSIIKHAASFHYVLFHSWQCFLRGTIYFYFHCNYNIKEEQDKYHCWSM